MKHLNKKSWSIITIIVGCLFLLGWMINNHYQINFVTIILWPIMILYIFLVTYWLYKEEWKTILGLSIKNVSTKIIFKALGIGLLISVWVNVSVFLFVLFFNMPYSNFQGNGITEVVDTILFFVAIFIAPFAEELMFRGFIQGTLAKNYSLTGNKHNIRIVILVIAFLFTVFHIRYIIYAETMQWIVMLLGIFVFSLYVGYLRNKSQSIIPSVFAHFGFNISAPIVSLIMFIIMALTPSESGGGIKQKWNQMEFKNDSIYNFDPNDIKEFDKAQRKFLAFHNEPHPELKIYFGIERRTALVRIWYDIDTSGFTGNFRLDSSYIRKRTYTGTEIEKEAFRLVEMYPQHKPYIKDGKKTNLTQTAFVRIYY